MISRYSLDFVLHARGSSLASIKNSLSEFSEELKISGEEKENCDYRVSMVTEDPVLVFDLCAQIGRIRSIKVNENSI